jgi:hypothetical protein
MNIKVLLLTSLLAVAFANQASDEQGIREGISECYAALDETDFAGTEPTEAELETASKDFLHCVDKVFSNYGGESEKDYWMTCMENEASGQEWPAEGYEPTEAEVEQFLTEAERTSDDCIDRYYSSDELEATVPIEKQTFRVFAN